MCGCGRRGCQQEKQLNVVYEVDFSALEGCKTSLLSRSSRREAREGWAEGANHYPETEKGSNGFILTAEGEGFESPARLRAPVFKTGVIDHSTILPNRVNWHPCGFCGCKGMKKFRV